MFISFSLKKCLNCSAAEETLILIDKKISELTNCVYNQETYMLKCKANERLLSDLIFYKSMLKRLAQNKKFYRNYSYKQIVSKIKTLI